MRQNTLFSIIHAHRVITATKTEREKETEWIERSLDLEFYEEKRKIETFESSPFQNYEKRSKGVRKVSKATSRKKEIKKIP